MEKIALKSINPAAAEKAMNQAGLNDPLRGITPKTIAAAGQAFELTNENGTGVFVAEKRGAELWIHGAGSSKTTGLVLDGLAVVEALARASMCTLIAFQTTRPGLVRMAQKNGYRKRAIILEKSI